MKRKGFLSMALIFITLMLSSCQKTDASAFVPPKAGLVVYTCLAEELYSPIIKEFSERTGMFVRIETGTSRQLLSLLTETSGISACDIVFGIDIEALEQHKQLWLPYESPNAAFISEGFRSSDNTFTTFSTLPLVIMYNTNVVTYRELPTGWSSLLEPRWKGRIAFATPTDSDLYASALIAASRACPQISDFPKLLAENLNYQTLEQLSDVNQGIMSGQYSLGVTLEESAQVLLSNGADIDYIYPSEGTMAISDGTAIVNGSANPEAAKDFIDFTISKDAQQILVTSLNRRTIREDVSPPAGLTSLSQLPLITYDLTEIPEERDLMNEYWNQLIESGPSQERRALP